MIHSKEDLMKIRNFDINNMKDILDKLIENNIIEITSSGEIKYIISNEDLSISEFGDSKLQVNNDELQGITQSDSIIVPLKKEIEEYKQIIEKKKTFLKELQSLFKEKNELMQFNQQLDDEIYSLMSKIYGDYNAKRK